MKRTKIIDKDSEVVTQLLSLVFNPLILAVSFALVLSSAVLGIVHFILEL